MSQHFENFKMSCDAFLLYIFFVSLSLAQKSCGSSFMNSKYIFAF